MPNKKSAKKALRQSIKRYLHNRKIKERIREKIKEYRILISENKQEEARKMLSLLYKLIDKAGKRNVFKKNKCSRLKSKLAKLLSPVQK